MKRRTLIIIAALTLFTGCATTPKSSYVVPESLQSKSVSLVKSVILCIKPTSKTGFAIANSKEPNAYYTNGYVYFTEGMFQFDDDTLKFVMAHEIAHQKLGHVQKAQGVSLATTGAMMIVNVFVPGAGLLNHAINPAVVNNYSKSQEYEADREASKACECMGISQERQIEIMRSMKAKLQDAGGFWDRHPSWDERIENIRGMK